MAYKVKNWDDWFNMCGTMVKDLQTYESAMRSYYFDVWYHKTEQKEAQAAYQSKHNIGFYRSEKKFPTWKKQIFAKTGFLSFLFGVIVATLVFALLGRNDQSNLGTVIVNKLLMPGLPCGVGLMALVVGIQMLLYRMKAGKYFKQMRIIENRLIDKIPYIPPKYRNSQSVNVFYDLYCSYGIVTFNQAISTCDDYLISNNLIGAYMAVMFDVPYMNAGIAEKKSDDERQLKANQEVTDPALPDDIKSKTFSGIENPEQKLEDLIGLEKVKTQVRQMQNRMNFYGKKDNDSVSGNHMVFLGSPGTGKTTVARILTTILYNFGYIRENKCVEIDGGYLKSPYQGKTAERTSAILKYAMGGVLFIDEAYTLMESSVGSPGQEAVGILLKALEDCKSEFVCILAGYEDSMNRLLSSNEGFASRIKYKIYFDDFTADEMGDIFRRFMRNSSTHRYKMEKEAFEILKRHFDRERKIPGFGNARVVRTAWDSILDVHADAFMRGEISEENKYVILKSDVQSFIEVRSKQMVEDGRNFIASRNLDSSVISLQELKSRTKPGSENPDEELAKLTGLSVVKDEIKRMKAQFSFYDGLMENNGSHMVFLGPPGTGKTTVASIMTGYLYQMGMIADNSYLDINGDFLRGMYLGHTGKRTEAVVQYSQGMVLFIDEAYLLNSQGNGQDSFGQEAVGVLIDAMEKYRKNFVVIFAGYDGEMNQFLDMNSGLRSRISLFFHFQSYTPHELAQMLKSVAADAGFEVEREAWIPIQRYFKQQLMDPKFGNGRFVRQFFEELKKVHIMRYADGHCREDQKYRLLLEDFKEFMGPEDPVVQDMDPNADFTSE